MPSFLICLLTCVSLFPHHTRGDGDCMAPVQNPEDIFDQQSGAPAQALEFEYADDFEECNNICCRDDECTVTVFDPDPSTPDTPNCLLYACLNPASCSIPQRQGDLTFLNAELFHDIQSNEQANPNSNSNSNTNTNRNRPNHNPNRNPNPVSESNDNSLNAESNTQQGDDENENDFDQENPGNIDQGREYGNPKEATDENSEFGNPHEFTDENSEFGNPNEVTDENGEFGNPNQATDENREFGNPNEDTNQGFINTTGNNPNVSSSNNSSEFPVPPPIDSILEPSPIPSPELGNSTLPLPPQGLTVHLNNSEQLPSMPISNIATSVMVMNSTTLTTSLSNFTTFQTITPSVLNEASNLPAFSATGGLELEPSATVLPVSSTLSPSSLLLSSSPETITNLQSPTPVLPSVTSVLSSSSVIVTSAVVSASSSSAIPSATATQAENPNQAANEDHQSVVQPTHDDNQTPALEDITEPTEDQDIASRITSTAVFGDSLVSDINNEGISSASDMKPFPMVSGPMGAVLITAMIIGCVLFVGVVAVMSKRLIDSYRKHGYNRLEDYLINGMYN